MCPEGKRELFELTLDETTDYEVMNDFIEETGLKKEFTDSGELLQNKGFSDVKLKIGERKICFHKNILSIKSQSFKHFDSDFLSEETLTRCKACEVAFL